MAPTLKNRHELEAMRHAGRIVGACHRQLRDMVRPGVTTRQLNAFVHEYIVQQGGIPSFLGYPGPTPFPAATCISVNEEIVHGIPGPRVLRAGDVVKLDVTLECDGYIADSAVTVIVPPAAPIAKQLQRCARIALNSALEV